MVVSQPPVYEAPNRALHLGPLGPLWLAYELRQEPQLPPPVDQNLFIKNEYPPMPRGQPQGRHHVVKPEVETFLFREAIATRERVRHIQGVSETDHVPHGG